MVEQYVIEEIKKLKEENEKLKQELNDERNKLVNSVEGRPCYIELIDRKIIIDRLIENNIDPIKMYDEYGTNEFLRIIKELNLYKDKFKQGKEAICIVRYNNKYYEMISYYNEYKICDEVYMDLEKAIYHELVDELYDILGNYKRKIEQEKKESEEK